MAVVRLGLEYACQLWSPGTMNLITKLKKTQRSFTKYVFNMYELTYEHRLKELNLYSIQRRRDRYRIIYMWKILEEKVTNLNAPIVTNSRLFSSLPKSVKNITDVDTFCVQAVTGLFSQNSYVIHQQNLSLITVSTE